jgi:uncharacterized protein (TIGR02231 family)
MKKSLLFFLLFLTLTALNAATEPPQKVASTIKEVTVYLSGAKLNSEGSVTLKSGNNDVVFENLPIGFNAASLQVRLKGSAELLSAKFKMRYPEAAKENSKAQVIRDSIQSLTDYATEINNEISILNGEEQIISNGSNRVGTGQAQSNNTTMTVVELRSLTEFYQTRMLTIRKRVQALGILIRENNFKINLLRTRFNELTPSQGKQSGEIAMQIYSPTAQTIDINCLYFVQDAAWKPMYDLRSEGIDKPLTLTYKAGIKQNTGYDWTNVKMHLSTVNPNFDNSRPILSPQYVDYYIVAIQVSGQVVTSNADVKLSPPPPAEVSKNYSLTQTASGTFSNMATTFLPTVIANPSGKTSEVPITLPVENLDFSNNELKNNVALNLAFDVPMNQTIPTGGEEYIVKVEENTLKNVVYQYHSVPKLDPSVFLLAKITDYGQYNLMPAYASIFFEDTYIGQSYIDPKTVADTLMLSLGRDENITIKRAKPIDIKSESKIIGNSKKEIITYEITIKNNKWVAIPIEILDQVPISRQKDIEIEVDKETLGTAEYNKDFGKVFWRLKIEPNSSKRLRFGYSVKYPKDKVISVN